MISNYLVISYYFPNIIKITDMICQLAYRFYIFLKKKPNLRLGFKFKKDYALRLGSANKVSAASLPKLLEANGLSPVNSFRS